MDRILIIVTLQALLLLSAIGQDKLIYNSIAYHLSPVDNSDVQINEKVIWSHYVNDHFKLFISFPQNYDSLRHKKYPVLYFLDGGDMSFHPINKDFIKKGVIPEIITIGIGYAGSNKRNRDYTYGFDEFYKFMKYELIPSMDKQYNIDPTNRTLFGHSYGGLCVLFTMFEYHNYEDILFRNLIASSPSLWYGDWRPAIERENKLYKKTNILPVNLYMGVGSLEGFMVTDLQKMHKILEDHNYNYLNMTTDIYEGKNHSTAKDMAYREGIKWVYAQDIKIPTTTHSDSYNQLAIATGLYPNPATNNLNLTLPTSADNKNINYKIINSIGKEVITLNQIINGQTIHISVEGLPKGLYIIHLSKGLEKQTLKFIKN